MADRVQNAASEGSSGRSSVVLTEADYESLWLRIKDRYWKHFWASLGLVLLLGTLAGYSFARISLEDSVSKYVQSDDFKARIARYTMENVPDLKKSLAELEARESELSAVLDQKKVALDEAIASRQKLIDAMTLPPISVAPGSLTLVAANGRKVRIDFGRSKVGPGSLNSIGGRHTFGAPFQAPPLVILSPVNPEQGRYTIPYGAANVTEKGFDVAVSSSTFGGAHVDWVAIGE